MHKQAAIITLFLCLLSGCTIRLVSPDQDQLSPNQVSDPNNIKQDEGIMEEKSYSKKSDDGPKGGGYFILNSSRTDKASAGIEYGQILRKDSRSSAFLVGVGLSGIFYDDAPDFIDTTIPHDDFTSHRGIKDGWETEFYLRLGRSLVFKHLFLSGLLGVSYQNVVDLDRSNVTGWYWLRDKKTVWHGTIGGDAFYIIELS